MVQGIFSKKRLKLFLKGMGMGAADTVPGVSGGTIAFITNIYEELIFSIQSCNLKAIQTLRKEGVKAAWKHINGDFLLTLFLGIIFAAFILANIISSLLNNFGFYVMAFFIGLILASSLFIKKQISVWNWQKYLLLTCGILLAVLLNLIPEYESQSSLLVIFLSGAIAICAMVLPGISGAFILVLFGVYEGILESVRDLDFQVILTFVAGCLLGLISFSNLLATLFFHKREQTFAVLLGILLGSIYTVWPKQLEFKENTFLYWGVFFVLVLIGFMLVYILEKGGMAKITNSECIK